MNRRLDFFFTASRGSQEFEPRDVFGWPKQRGLEFFVTAGGSCFCLTVSQKPRQNERVKIKAYDRLHTVDWNERKLPEKQKRGILKRFLQVLPLLLSADYLLCYFMFPRMKVSSEQLSLTALDVSFIAEQSASHRVGFTVRSPPVKTMREKGRKKGRWVIASRSGCAAVGDVHTETAAGLLSERASGCGFSHHFQFVLTNAN